MRIRSLFLFLFRELCFLVSSSWRKYFWSFLTVEGTLLCVIKLFPQLYRYFSLPFLVVSTQGDGTPTVVQPTANSDLFPSFLMTNWYRKDGPPSRVTLIPGVLHTVWERLRRRNHEASFVATNGSAVNDSTSSRTSSMQGVQIFCRPVCFLLFLFFRLLVSAVRQRTLLTLLSPSSSAHFFSRLFGLLSPRSLLSCGLLGMTRFFCCCFPLERDLWEVGIALSFLQDAYPTIMLSCPTTATLVSLCSAAAVKQLLIFVTHMRMVQRSSLSSTFSSLLDDRWADGDDVETRGEKGRGKEVLRLLEGILLRACTLREDTVDYYISALSRVLWMKEEKNRRVTPSTNSPVYRASSDTADTRQSTPSATPTMEWRSPSVTAVTPEESGGHDDHVGVSSPPLSPSSRAWEESIPTRPLLSTSFPSPPSTVSHAVLAFTNGIFDGFIDTLVGFLWVVDANRCREIRGPQTVRSRLIRLVHFYSSLRFSRLFAEVAGFEASIHQEVQRVISISLASVWGWKGTVTPTAPSDALESLAADERSEDPTRTVSSSSLPLPCRGEEGSSGSTAYLVPVSMEYFLSSFNRITFMAAGVVSGYAFLGSRFLVGRTLEWLSEIEWIELTLERMGFFSPVRIPTRLKDLPLPQLKWELRVKMQEMGYFLIHAERVDRTSKMSCFTKWRTRRKMNRTQNLVNLLISLRDEEVEDCMCPITLCLMENPVSTFDGHTYDEKAITEWLRTHQTSPLTNVSLSDSSLTYNKEVKRRVQLVVKALCFTA